MDQCAAVERVASSGLWFSEVPQSMSACSNCPAIARAPRRALQTVAMFWIELDALIVVLDGAVVCVVSVRHRKENISRSI